MIHNKSIHPVEVKRISVRIWSLRDEIEAALQRRVKECEAAGIPVNIDDIKQFYKFDKNATPTPDNVIPLNQKSNASSEETPKDEAPKEAAPEATEETPAPVSELKEGEEGEKKADQEAKMENQTTGQVEGAKEESKSGTVTYKPFARQPPEADKISYGFSFLGDINMDSVLVFTQEHFLQGQSVVVEFLIPQHFSMTAEISYSYHFARTSRIISEENPKYRVQCKFKYLVSGERDLLRDFLKSIEPSIPVPKKKEKKEIDLDSLEI